MNNDLLARLRDTDTSAEIAKFDRQVDLTLLSEWQQSDVKFVSTGAHMERKFYQAVSELFSCIKPTFGDKNILNEGGVYLGCWIESTGTINTELMSRFMPDVAQSTYEILAEHQFEDGLFPYKITADGPAYFQIQIVTPLARCVWNQYFLNGKDKKFLRKMYDAMVRYDDWLAKYRDTRGTGGVEAFCCHDTGHDMSARFWHVPDAPHNNDPRTFDPDNPILPFVAPDLTANVACQRSYLAHMAEELGEDSEDWHAKTRQSLDALFTYCWNDEDGIFYDYDKHNRHVKVQSDVLLRVLACEVGDDDFFAKALDRYLLNTAKFFARYPFTSIAMDDPRFDQDFSINSWCGPTNALSIIRAPHAFEAHHRHVELTFAMHPILYALFRNEEFSQCLNPYTGQQGFTKIYAPMILCLLDFVERLCGVLPRPNGTLWFTGLVPYNVEQKQERFETAYSRTVDGHVFELVNSSEKSTAFRDGELLFSAPKGIRVVTDRRGEILSIIGMTVQTVEGVLKTANGQRPFIINPNQQLDWVNGVWVNVRDIGYVAISS
ncbi:MAG: hypothetical protein JKY31_04455 [Rhodobacteraceae bacterium]|nr:hypothetical protein [Paracoccaceae bacterium]